MTINESSFHSDHLADLRKSGLTDDTIALMNVYTVCPGDISRVLGWDPKEVNSILAFPYPNTDGFVRYKIFPAFKDKDGHTVKYLQKKGTGAHLYILQPVEEVLRNPSVPLAITEGEKKAAALVQSGTMAIGMGGIWNWRDGQSHKVIEDFDRITWADRPVLLYFDSDIWHPPDLLKPVYALGQELEGRGALIQIVVIEQKGQDKVGIDDFLVANGLEALPTLKTISLRHKGFSQASVWWKGWYNDCHRSLEGVNFPECMLNSLNSLNSHPVRWVKPLNADVCYGLVGEFVKKIEPHTESDPAAILIQFLTYFGNVIGNKSHFKVEATEHHLKLNSALVGPTSKGRKGTAYNIVNYIYKSIDPLWVDENIVSGLSSGEGVISTLSDDDDSKKDKRLLIVEPEFSSTLKVMAREGNILSGIMRQAWDGKNLRNLTKNNPLRASNTHISMIVHITITELRKYLNETERANGFGNRFLYFLVKRSKCLPEGGQFYTLDFSHLVKRLRDVVEFAKTVDEIKRDNEAVQIWRDVYPVLSEGKPGVVGDLTARAEAYVMRIACIYALLDCSAIVRVEHLNAALAVWGYAESCVEFIFGDISGDSIADKIYIALKANENGLSRTEIIKILGKHRSSSEISRALELLLKCNKAKNQTISTEGRDKEIWTVAN